MHTWIIYQNVSTLSTHRSTPALSRLLRYPLSDSFPLHHLYTPSHSMSIALTSVVIVTSEESGVKLCERTVVVPTGKV